MTETISNESLFTATMSAGAVEEGEAFLRANARPLDLAWFDHANGQQVKDRVLAALAAYQASDGGFGGGIEPDIRSPASSALGTSVAFQYLRAVGAGSDNPVVGRAVAYLVATVDRETWTWPIVGPRIDEAPHAPWWALDGLADRFGGFALNPTAELLGYLFDYRRLAPGDVLEAVQQGVLGALARNGALESYDLLCCIRLLQTEDLPPDLRERLEARVADALRCADPEDPHLDLTGVLPSPRCRGYDSARALIGPQLDRLVSARREGGGWGPFWDWSDVDAAAWRQAERDWSGAMTARALIALAGHGRLAD